MQHARIKNQERRKVLKSGGARTKEETCQGMCQGCNFTRVQTRASCSKVMTVAEVALWLLRQLCIDMVNDGIIEEIGDSHK